MGRKRVVLALLTVVVIGSLAFLNSLLKPKYMGAIIEGALIAEYYEETTDHDVIFIGDCEVYENFSPITLWEEYGITSYIRGSAQQLIWQSYYLLEETLKYEKPKVVVFNVLAMKYDTPQKEAYNRMTLDGMRWSMSKARDIRASMTEEEQFIEYVFPKQKTLGNYQLGSTAYEYLDKITNLCRENGIQLILIKAPSVYPSWYDQWDQQMEEYAKKNQIRYINFLNLQEEIGLDFETDTYDGGLHLNLSGAQKLSQYFGQILRQEYGLSNHQTDSKLAQAWKPKVEFYYQMKAEQERDLEQYGYIRKFHEE